MYSVIIFLILATGTHVSAIARRAEIQKAIEEICGSNEKMEICCEEAIQHNLPIKCANDSLDNLQLAAKLSESIYHEQSFSRKPTCCQVFDRNWNDKDGRKHCQRILLIPSLNNEGKTKELKAQFLINDLVDCFERCQRADHSFDYSCGQRAKSGRFLDPLKRRI